MHLVVIGLNHKTAPVEIREKLSIPVTALSKALSELRSYNEIQESLILSTCNRMEIYAYTNNRSDDHILIDWLGRFCNLRISEFHDNLYSYSGHKAAEHLFRVASSLDSMVIGEAQILAQVREAYSIASQDGNCGPVLNTLLKQAITVGKRVRTETDIGKGAFSVGSVAVQLAKSIFDDLKGRTTLIIGAGQIGELTITHLVSSGVNRVLVANRTHERAVNLAARFDGEAVLLDDLSGVLSRTDIVITSTGAKNPIITREMVTSAIEMRKGRPVFFIDIAVPRDIEQGVSDIDNVFVYNIDDLQKAVDMDMDNRKAEIEAIDDIIGEEVDEFNRWFRELDAVPVITALRAKFEEIRLAEIERLKAKRPGLSEEDLAAIDQATKSIIHRMCHQPMIQIKEYCSDTEASSRLSTVCEVFGICIDDENKNGS